MTEHRHTVPATPHPAPATDAAESPNRFALGLPYALLIAAAFALLTWASWNGLSELGTRWLNDEAYSHGILMPLIILFLVAGNRERIERRRFTPSWTGFALFSGALVFLVAEISQILTLIHYAYLAALCGLIWAVMGRASHYVLIPVSLLLFAIPLPYFAQASLTADLQYLSTQFGVAMLELIDVPVFTEGNIIDLGVFQLQVVEACAGLNYLFPLLGIGHICAYLFQGALWKRIVIVLSCIPVAVLMNAGRIAATGLMVKAYGPAAAEGFFHYFQGWLVFVLSTAFLIGEMAVLNRIGGRSMPLWEMFDLRRQAPGDGDPAAVTPKQTRRIPATLVAGVAAIGMTLVATYAVSGRAEVIPERSPFALFPAMVDDWIGRRSALDANTLGVLEVDDYLISSYASMEEDANVELFVAYYESQRSGAGPHSPKVCLPGGGWEILAIDRVSVPIPGHGMARVNRAVIQKGRDNRVAYYWFQQRGRIFANEFAMKWHLFKDGLLMNRSDGALVRVLTPIHRAEDAELAEQRLQHFVQDMWPVLPGYVPGGNPLAAAQPVGAISRSRPNGQTAYRDLEIAPTDTP